jgi:CheY-like chemotaxis protein
VAIADAPLTADLASLRGQSMRQLLLLSSGIGLSQSAAASAEGGTTVLVKPARRGALFDALAQLRNRAAAMGIPHATSSAAVAPASAAASLAGMAQRLPLRILVAEDNPTNVKLIKMVLGGLGYRPDIAGNGLEVLAALRRQPYDVVLMDVRMPELDGIETTRCIRDEWRNGQRPRIVALTAGVMPEERKACLDAGVDEFLVKPAVRASLIEALERCCPLGASAEAAPAAQAGL